MRDRWGVNYGLVLLATVFFSEATHRCKLHVPQRSAAAHFRPRNGFGALSLYH
jgi:hypothetical protein